MSVPRILTVDPTGSIARMVRAAIELTDRSVIQVDVPRSQDALDEVSRGGYDLLVTSLGIDRQMKGVDLARRVRQSSPDTAIVIVADADDPGEPDEETGANALFVIMRRPVDIHQFLRVFEAGLSGGDALKAITANTSAPGKMAMDFGPVPAVDSKAAFMVVDKVLTDVGAQAAVLSSRSGEVLIERGGARALSREQLSSALLPVVQATVSMRELVGGHADGLHFFDGEAFDVFVLTVGYHHFLSLIFDGNSGSRQFGAVTRFGRRSAEDLKALIGAGAMLIEPRAPVQVETRVKTPPFVDVELELVEPLVVKAETWDNDETSQAEPEPTAQLDPIDNFDPRILEALSAVDDSAADALFDMDRVAEIATESRRGRGPISYEEARELGIVP